MTEPVKRKWEKGTVGDDSSHISLHIPVVTGPLFSLSFEGSRPTSDGDKPRIFPSISCRLVTIVGLSPSRNTACYPSTASTKQKENGLGC